ncbi:NUDIX hydrolase [Massilia sp. CFBP9012]|uniref:NUDIX hydrolase n=1 Tax=Massilia sp. CFBP9012 TaxID=3096531 RepID=UPI002A69ABAD|nr:NUDIX hydrolase [Massilia sp. CFBP9012]MDY0977197.1 NUDIX hydrolase [Massilia sp. CFBP9012]
MNDAAVHHPQPDEHGKPVLIARPSLPTALDTWLDPARVATVIPLGALPPMLNGVPFGPWIDAPATNAAWSEVAGQADIVEPAFDLPPSKSPAAGVVIVEDDGRVWAVSPSNRFGGYDATFPKGRVDPGVSLQATAIREAFEESGLRVEILAHLVDSARTLTYTRYYLARRIGGNPALMGWESQAAHLIPQADLPAVLCNPNDCAVIDALMRSMTK